MSVQIPVITFNLPTITAEEFAACFEKLAVIARPSGEVKEGLLTVPAVEQSADRYPATKVDKLKVPAITFNFPTLTANEFAAHFEQFARFSKPSGASKEGQLKVPAVEQPADKFPAFVMTSELSAMLGKIGHVTCRSRRDWVKVKKAYRVQKAKRQPVLCNICGKYTN